MLKRARGATIAAVLLLAGCVSKDDKAGAPKAGQEARMLAHRANPTVETIVADSSKDPNAIEVTQIAGYNDEQKLPTNASWNDFGPIARLYTLRRARTTPEYQAGAMVAVLEVEPQAPMPPAYSRLGIADNAGPNADVYCVFLQRTTNPGKPWQAALSKVTSTGRDCEPPEYTVDADSTAPALNSTTDFPDYAVRFTEGTNKMAAMAVRCYNAICEIGNPSGGNSVSSSPGNGRANVVKPWHDTQRLAKEKGGGRGGFDPGTQMTITPVENLATIKAAFYTPTGAQAATIMVHGTPQGTKYSTWKLRANDSVQVWLRADSTRPDSTRWQMRMMATTSPRDSTIWRRIAYIRHTDSLVPATARWKWDPADEGIWVGCDQGCCEMTGGFGFVVTGNGDTVFLPPRDTSGGRGRGRGNP